MLKAPTEFIILFIIVSVLLILAMAVFISIVIYRYQQKQNLYFKDIEMLKAAHENTLLQSQLEIREQTFQNISREIHDNIEHQLTLAKLYLNTFDFANKHKARQQVSDSVNIIGETITDLRDLRRSTSSEIILKNGIMKALEHELNQLKKSGLYQIIFSTTGNPVYLSNNTALVLFRIVQEVLNNIVKHSAATVINMQLHYSEDHLTITIQDNGKGFNVHEKHQGAGIQNIKNRTAILKGDVHINSAGCSGTKLKIKIPLYENQ